MNTLTHAVVTFFISIVARVRAVFRVAGTRLSQETGDVPGWVLITLMTAGLVIALWAVASDALIGLFTQAMDQF